MRHTLTPTILGALALTLAACGGGDPQSEAEQPDPSTSVTESATPTPSASETTASTSSASPTSDASTAAAEGTETGADESSLPAPSTEGGSIEVDSRDENGNPTSWTEYDAAGNPIGAAVGGPPPGQEGSGESDYEAAVQDPESIYYGMTVEEAQAADQYVYEGLGGDESADEWLDWFDCTTAVYHDYVDSYPADGTEEELDAHYATDLDALETEQCGPEPA